MDIKTKKRNLRLKFLCIGTFSLILGFIISLKFHEEMDAFIYFGVLSFAVALAVPYIIIFLCAGGMIAKLVYSNKKFLSAKCQRENK